MTTELNPIELTVTCAGKTIIHTATREEFDRNEMEDLVAEAPALILWTLLALKGAESPYVRYK